MTTRNYLSQREFLAIIFIATLLFSLSPCSSAPEESDTWSVSWNAPFLSISGYGSEATSFLVGLNRTLSREKWNLAAGLAHGDMIDEKYVDKIPEDLKDLLETSYQNQMRRMDPNKTIVICHSEPGAWSVPDPLYDPGWPCPPPLAENRKWQKMIGRTMFETDRLPANWNHRLNEMDEIWVPTHHHEQIFTDAGVKKPIVVVGQGIDIEYWNPEIRQEYFMEQYDKKFRCSNDDFKFLSVFKWEARKGPDILLPSFYEAFPNGEGACLIIITSSYHGDTNLVVDEVKRIWIEATKGMNGNKAQGVILMTGLPLRNLVRMYKSVDAFVLPSRGEGWGRPYMEAMSMGLPVIATNWSGPTEFVNEKNGYLLPIRGLVDAGLNSFPGHKWADPDPDELVRFFKHLKENPNEAERKGNQARRDIVEKWSNDAISRVVARHLERLSGADISFSSNEENNEL